MQVLILLFKLNYFSGAVGKIIEQALKELKISYELIQPRTAKVTPLFFEKLTGIKTKNQEMIDAGMLVYGL